MDHDTLLVDDDPEALLQRSMADGWGDGLPLIPPTPDRVERALAQLTVEPERVLGEVSPAGIAATVFSVTVNALMAGCSQEHLPIVYAAVEAMCRPEFNLASIQVTTNPVATGGFVSGPAAARAGLNHGGNALGPGNRANATIGRALRLVMLNIGGGQAGTVDKATFGHPGKYTLFFAENTSGSPWPSWATRCGYPEGASVVTVLGVVSLLNLLETSDTADDLLDAFSVSMAFPNSNDQMLQGEPTLVLCPEHVEVLARDGYDIPAIQQRLWTQTRLPVRAFSASTRRYRLVPTWTPVLGELADDVLIPLCGSPEGIRIVVSGGPGRHSMYMPGFGVSRCSTASVDTYVSDAGVLREQSVSACEDLTD